MLSPNRKYMRRAIYGVLLAMMLLGGIGSQVYAADLIADSTLMIDPALTTNLLKNGAFNFGSTSPVITTGLNDPSAANNWTTWNKHYDPVDGTYNETTTELLPSTLVAGGKMLHVTTTGYNNGIVQVFGPENTGPEKAFGCAWLYIVSGHVGIGTGNGGATNADDVVLRKSGSWERVEVSNAHSPANEFIMYSTNTDGAGAEFFVEFASVTRTRSSCTPK